MSELSLENVLVQVKDALNSNGIKLWLSPYYLEMESNESEMLVRKKILICVELFLNNFFVHFT